MADPTFLTGSVAQFNGDPAELAVVTPTSVMQAYADNTNGESSFLNSVMGCACDGLMQSKGQILSDSGDALATIMANSGMVDPCVWLKAYAPMSFYQDFSKNDTPDTGDPLAFWGLWIIDATTYYYGVTEPFLCDHYPFTYRWTTAHRHWYHWGYTPVGCFGQLPSFFCPDGDNFQLNDGGCDRRIIYLINGPRSDLGRYCVPGTVTVQPVWYDRPDAQGGLYMPIPPIPSGIPTPQPLQGCAVTNISSGDASTLVTLGGGLKTLSDLTAVTVGDTSDNKCAFAEAADLPSPCNLLPLFAALSLGSEEQITTFTKLIVEDAKDCIAPTPEVVVDEHISTMHFERTTTVDGCLNWRLLVPAAIMEIIKLVTTTLEVDTCVEGQMIRDKLPFPILSWGNYSEQAIFQQILDMLGQLLRCCPPCEWNNWEKGAASLSGDGKVLHTFIDVVRFESLRATDPINTWHGDPTISKWGWIRWIFRDNQDLQNIEMHGEMMFINSDQQIFRAPTGNVIGFTYSFPPGVFASYLFKSNLWNGERTY